MIRKREELNQIIIKFAESGWDLIAVPANKWLDEKKNQSLTKNTATELILAVEKAEQECGSCGCEFDPLYKKFLSMRELLIK